MSINRPDRSIPQNIINRIRSNEIQAISHFNLRNFKQSLVLFNEILSLLYKTQEELGRSIHKGAPLHMIGINYNAMNNHAEAIRYILSAYIEDNLNVELDNEAEANNSPAGQTLLNYYNIHPNLLRDINDTVSRVKREGNWATILNPEQIIDELNIVIGQATVTSGSVIQGSTVPLTQTPPQDPFGFPQPWENRVFIGGCYHTHMPVIRYIQQLIENFNYTPIVAFDIDIDREHTHHHTLLLLHTCKYAIFDVSSPAGQLMEIERTIDYGNEVLLLYSTLTAEGGPSPLVSSMLRTMDIEMNGYANFDDIDPIIQSFLPHLEQ